MEYLLRWDGAANVWAFTLYVALLVCLAVRPACAQNGDLYYPIGWTADLTNPDGYSTWIDLYMWDEYGSADEDHEPGHAYVHADIPARTVDNTVSAAVDWYVDYPYPGAGWTYLGRSEDSVVAPGAGPGSVSLLSSAFIAADNLVFPFDGGWNDWRMVFGGDDRSFDCCGGTARLTLAADIYNSAVDSDLWLVSPVGAAGMTQLYDGETSLDASGRLTQAAKNDWTPGVPLKRDWATASDYPIEPCSNEHLGPDIDAGTSTVRVECTMYGSNPLIPFSPDIDWTFTLTIVFGSNSVHWSVEGGRDGFPSYEAYLNGNPLFTASDNGDPLSLFGSGDTAIPYLTGDF